MGGLVLGAIVPSIRAWWVLRGVRGGQSILSKEEDVIPDTSWDEEITQKLFGGLNCGLLGSLGDGHIIILSDSDEEEEVREGDHIDVEAASSFDRSSLAPTTVADDDALNEVQDGSSGGGTLDQALDDSNDSGAEAGMS
jgi:hypothetical protein